MSVKYKESSKIKVLLFFYFTLSTFLLISTENINVLVVLAVCYGVFSIYNFVNQTAKRLPLGEIAVLVFFIENCFSLLVLVLNNKSLGNHLGDSYYCLIPEFEFLTFSFLASQAFLFGYYILLNEKNNIWKNFIQKKIYIINQKVLVWIIVVSFLGNIVIFLNVKSLFQIAYFFNKLLFCSFIGLIFSSKSINIFYLIISVSILFLTAIRTGMTGELIYFLLYAMLLFLLKINYNNFQSKLTIYAVLLLGFVTLTLIQNSKTSYRNEVWLGSREASLSTFSNVLKKEINNYNLLDLDSYTGMLYRLNQGYLVSAAMVKVPSQVSFVNGETIISSLKDAFIPRIFDPDKEEAGGRLKISRFTNLVLVGSTSMNIGLLGESYVNFGKVGAIFFIFIFGLLFAYFEQTVLSYGEKNIMVIIMFPIFFSSLVGSGGDFLMLLNTIVKGTVFIFFILSIIPEIKK